MKKSFLATCLLCFLLGITGAHRFYTGYIGIGIVQFLLLLSGIGIPFAVIWALIDLISIVNGSYKTKDGTELQNAEKLNNMAKTSIVCLLKVVLVAIIFMLVLIVIMLFVDNGSISASTTDNPSKITVEKYGEKYPFTIDNLVLKCENEAVWVEDDALNKYALNSLADRKFSGRDDYKGYTTSIEKPNPDTPGTTLGYGGMLELGFSLCK